MTPHLRGTIIKTPNGGPGLLIVQGQQKPFTLEGVWKSPVAPAVNMTVDVECDAAGAVTGLTAVQQQQISREDLEKRGKEGVEKVRQGIGALAARMGAVTLAATVVLWISWFLLPGIRFSIAFFGASQSQSVTLWHALALDRTTNMTAGSHGFVSLLVFDGLIAPFVAAFLRQDWGRYLYAAPLTCLILAYLSVHHEFNEFLAPMRQQLGNALDDAFSLSSSAGTYLILLASLAIAARLLQRPAAFAPALAGAPAIAAAGPAVPSAPAAAASSASSAFCANCGAARTGSSNFCPACGAKHASAAGA